MPFSGAGDPYSIKVFARNEEIDIKRTASYKRNKARLLGTIPACAGNIRASRYILVYNVIVHKSMLDDSLTRAESRRTLVLDSQLSEILLSFVSVHMCVRENGCSRSKEAAAVVGSRFRNRDAANFSPGYDIKF